MRTRRTFLESTSWLMAAMTAVFALLMLVDPRVIEGAPAWLKPWKFAVSTGVYGFTLAWILRQLPGRARLARWAGGITGVAFVVEVALIGMQAGRGTTSHFNNGTTIDAVVFAAMGVFILTQTLAAIAVTIALWRTRFTDRAMGWALRLGMTIAVIGSSVGGMMTRPTAAQVTLARAGGGSPRSGAHTIGGPDGGPGLPGTQWSTEHGDLRAPHFLGLHAIQALPLVALAVRRRRRETARVAAVVGAGLSYLTLFGLLLTQAFLGQPVLGPTRTIRTGLVIWAAVTLTFAVVAWRATNAPLTTRAATEVA